MKWPRKGGKKVGRKSVDEIIEMLKPHISDISQRTFFRRRKDAINALSSILWGYTSQDSLHLLEQFFPENWNWQYIVAKWQYIGRVLRLQRKYAYAIMSMLKTVSSADKHHFFDGVFCCSKSAQTRKPPHLVEAA